MNGVRAAGAWSPELQAFRFRGLESIKENADEESAEIGVEVNGVLAEVSIEFFTLLGSGTAPLTVSMNISNYIRAKVVTYRVDYEGDGTFDLEVPTLEYRIRREEIFEGATIPISYYVHFTKSYDVFWRLQRF